MVNEAMAFRAAAEPRLRRAMTIPNPMETETALSGMFQPGATYNGLVSGVWLEVDELPTFCNCGEKGKPLSRAKDQICRDAVAISLMTAEMRVMITMATMISVPAWLFVTL